MNIYYWSEIQSILLTHGISTDFEKSNVLPESKSIGYVYQIQNKLHYPIELYTDQDSRYYVYEGSFNGLLAELKTCFLHEIASELKKAIKSLNF